MNGMNENSAGSFFFDLNFIPVKVFSFALRKGLYINDAFDASG